MAKATTSSAHKFCTRCTGHNSVALNWATGKEEKFCVSCLEDLKSKGWTRPDGTALMSKHAAAPWTIRELGRGTDPEIALIRYKIETKDRPIGILEVAHRNGQGEADSRLIALAPEMLETLKFLVDNFAETCPECEGSGEPQKGNEERCERCCGQGEIVKDSIICEFHSMRKLIAKAS